MISFFSASFTISFLQEDNHPSWDSVTEEFAQQLHVTRRLMAILRTEEPVDVKAGEA